MPHTLIRASARTLYRRAGPANRVPAAPSLSNVSISPLRHGYRSPAPVRLLEEPLDAKRRPLPTRDPAHPGVRALTDGALLISPPKVQTLIADPASKAILIDVREPGELAETGRIPGAINIPITTQPDSFHITDEEFEDRFDFARPPRNGEVVFYCKAGVRARGAAQLARDAGWANVAEYGGSWLDWVKNGGKVAR